MHEKKSNLEELKNHFLKYVEVVTKDGKRFPFKPTRLQERLWKMWQDAGLTPRKFLARE